MINIHSYTKRVAKNKKVEDVLSNIRHVVFSHDELKEAKVVELFHSKDLYLVVDAMNESDAGMIVHRMTKKGEKDKRTSEIFVWNSHINVIYVEPVEASVEPVELFEFEGEQFHLRTETGVKNLCNAFLNKYYGIVIKHKFEISKRMKTCLGYVQHYANTRKPSKIAFSSRLLEHGHIKVIADTIFHEMNHYGLMLATDLEFDDGSESFERACREFGGDLSVESVGLKHLYKCTKCDTNYPLNRKGSYACIPCKAPLEYHYEAIFDGLGGSYKV